jgi:carbonic anhydrase
MDARLDLFKMLGLEEGDAHIIRNAGGIVNDDVIRSPIISQHLLGTEEIVLVHHTDCGMLAFDELDLRRRVESQAGSSFIPAFRAAFLTILPKSASPSGLSLLL